MFRWLIPAMALCLAACSTYTSVPFEREAANVQALTLTDDMLPDAPTLTMRDTVGSALGIVGALADAGVASRRRAILAEAMRAADYDANTLFQDKVAEAIAAQGYDVAVLDVNRPDTDVLKHPPDAFGGDALLDVAVTDYGFMSPGLGRPWRPSFTVKLRLVDAAGTVLMDNRLEHNPAHATRGALRVPPVGTIWFETFDAMRDDPDRALAAMDEAMALVAATIAETLG